MYNYLSKLRIVVRWRERKGLQPVAKFGEMICYETNELINFFDDKPHEYCCGTV